MKAVVEWLSGRVAYLLAAPDVEITDSGLISSGRLIALDIRPANHLLVDAPLPVPDPWIDGAYAVVGDAWQVLDEAAVEAEREAARVVAPPPSLKVSMAQARAALHRQGLLGQVTAAVEAVGGEAAIAWEYATEVSRHSPLVTALAAAADLDEAAVDDLFRVAAQIEF